MTSAELTITEYREKLLRDLAADATRSALNELARARQLMAAIDRLEGSREEAASNSLDLARAELLRAEGKLRGWV